MRWYKCVIPLYIVLGLVGYSNADEPPKYFQLGDFTLENGDVIREASLAYRTVGELNQDSSNVLLCPTWFTGSSEGIIQYFVGTDKLADPRKHYIIAVDAFGNGVSSSPSKSELQPGNQFPQFSIRDMVYAQHRLLIEELGFTHIHAVVGFSMGGMQALQWMVSYPDFMDKIVSVSGTPRQTSYDLLLWHAELRAIEAARENRDFSSAMKVVAAIHALAMQTPQYHVQSTSSDSFAVMLAGVDASTEGHDPYDWAWQLKAMINHDIYKSLSETDDVIAEKVKARIMLAVAPQDHMVNPEPSRILAAQLGVDVYEIDNPCGHLAVLCGGETPIVSLAAFLTKE